MIRIIDKTNRSQFPKSLDQYFRLRYEVFTKELGWCQPNEQLTEIDQYDDDNAVYILSIDDNGDVAGCFRLYPTALPHMLIDYFSSMVDGPLLQKPDVFELTRFAITDSKRKGGVTYRELYLGMLEYCLSEGITGIVAVLRTSRITPLLGIGMNVRPLGLSQEIGTEHNIAVYYDMNGEALSRVRSGAGVANTVLERNSESFSRVA